MRPNREIVVRRSGPVTLVRRKRSRPLRKLACLGVGLTFTLATFLCVVSVCALSQTAILVAARPAATRTPLPTFTPTSLPTFTPTAILGQVTHQLPSPTSPVIVSGPTAAPIQHTPELIVTTQPTETAPLPTEIPLSSPTATSPAPLSIPTSTNTPMISSVEAPAAAATSTPTIILPTIPIPTIAPTTALTVTATTSGTDVATTTIPKDTPFPGRWPTYTPTPEVVSQNG